MGCSPFERLDLSGDVLLRSGFIEAMEGVGQEEPRRRRKALMFELALGCECRHKANEI